MNSIKRLSLTNLSLSISALLLFNVLSCYFVYTHMTKYPVVQLRWISTIARSTFTFTLSRSTFTFTRGLSYNVSFSFTRVNFTCVRTEKFKYATVEINPYARLPATARKNEPALIPSSPFGEDQSPHLGDSGNRA